MAIGPVVTRGYGTFGTVNLVVTRGYTASAVAVPTKAGPYWSAPGANVGYRAPDAVVGFEAPPATVSYRAPRLPGED